MNEFKAKSTFLAFLLLTMQLVLPIPALADGMVIKPYSDRWDYASETNQQVYINYDNGMEKMILSIGINDLDKSDAVWIFPIPSNPDKISVNIIKDLPRLSGEDISKKAKLNLSSAKDILQLTQIYTLPFVYMTRSVVLKDDIFDGTITGRNLSQNATQQDVIVYEHLEKEGITSEIITAKTASALYDYLNNKGLNIQSGALPMLDKYIGQDFSFVISWISSPKQILTPESIKPIFLNCFLYPERYPAFTVFYNNFKQKYPVLLTLKDHYEITNYLLADNYITTAESKQILSELISAIENNPSLLKETGTNSAFPPMNNIQRGLFVTFPTPEIYFPLIPTSVYGSEMVPATIRIIGHVTPKIPDSIKAFTKINYYLDNNYNIYGSVNPTLNFYNPTENIGPSYGYSESVKYTKIEINSPSKYFTEDLWINSKTPLKIVFSSFLAVNPLFISIILLILMSTITGVIAGLSIFKEHRNLKGIKKFGFTGLFNCFSVIGLIIKIMLTKTKEDLKDAEPLLNEVRQKGYFGRRRLAFVLLIANTPFLLFSFFLIPSLIHDIKNYLVSGYFYNATEFIFFFMLPLGIFIITWRLKKIKKEDLSLFSELEERNYSLWSFRPKDSRKISFIAIFSLLFLTISWMLIKITTTVV